MCQIHKSSFVLGFPSLTMFVREGFSVAVSVHLNDLQVLGAWGLGWEIWMDGMEITQFTYFQQVIFILCKHF